MTTIFNDGFECPPNTAPSTFTAWTGAGAGVGSTCEIVNSGFRSGSYSCHINALNGQLARVYKDFSGVSRINVRQYVKVNSVTSDGSFWILHLAGGDILYVRFYYFGTANTILQVYNYTTTDTYNSSSFTTSTGSYFNIEVEVSINATTGYVKVWFNDDLKINQLNINTGTTNITSARCGIQYASSGDTDLNLDDVTIADEYIGSDVLKTSILFGGINLSGMMKL